MYLLMFKMIIIKIYINFKSILFVLYLTKIISTKIPTFLEN